MKMYVAGEWRSGTKRIPVIDPYTGEAFDEVPAATPEDVDRALAAAVDGAAEMRSLSGYERAAILGRAADLLDERAEDVALTISREVGKPISEAAPMPVRCGEILRLAAFEGTQARGETLPLDAHAGAVGKLGFTLREPVGVVVAITPFNYPLLLSVHKVGPALAAGNAVVLKPATQAPLTALKLTEILLEAGLPANGIQCITGGGSAIGNALCSDERVRKISFTGSTGVGRAIAAVAGVKRLSLELGATCPMIVMPDADLETAAQAAAIAGTVNAGQVCISLQNLLVHGDVYGDFLDLFASEVAARSVGDPREEGTQVGAMIDTSEAVRVKDWIDEAVAGGARLVVGGDVTEAVMTPAVVADVAPTMRVVRDELFGPAMTVGRVDDLDEGIRLVNGGEYGLAASLFTQDVDAAVDFARRAEAGNVHVNWTPLWRADFMPYGGLKGSGIGKEGPRYAVEEMTELKTVVIHGSAS
jgi:glyceraldehyde-3-phosphate dehydrogenase (NADP+)